VDKIYRVLHHDESKCRLELLVCVRKVTCAMMMFYKRCLGRCASRRDVWLMWGAVTRSWSVALNTRH